MFLLLLLLLLLKSIGALNRIFSFVCLVRPFISFNHLLRKRQFQFLFYILNCFLFLGKNQIVRKGALFAITFRSNCSISSPPSTSLSSPSAFNLMILFIICSSLFAIAMFIWKNAESILWKRHLFIEYIVVLLYTTFSNELQYIISLYRNWFCHHHVRCSCFSATMRFNGLTHMAGAVGTYSVLVCFSAMPLCLQHRTNLHSSHHPKCTDIPPGVKKYLQRIIKF